MGSGLWQHDLDPRAEFLPIGDSNANFRLIATVGIDVGHGKQGWRKRKMENDSLLSRLELTAGVNDDRFNSISRFANQMLDQIGIGQRLCQNQFGIESVGQFVVALVLRCRARIGGW